METLSDIYDKIIVDSLKDISYFYENKSDFINKYGESIVNSLEEQIKSGIFQKISINQGLYSPEIKSIFTDNEISENVNYVLKIWADFSAIEQRINNLRDFFGEEIINPIIEKYIISYISKKPDDYSREIFFENLIGFDELKKIRLNEFEYIKFNIDLSDENRPFIERYIGKDLFKELKKREIIKSIKSNPLDFRYDSYFLKYISKEELIEIRKQFIDEYILDIKLNPFNNEKIEKYKEYFGKEFFNKLIDGILRESYWKYFVENYLKFRRDKELEKYLTKEEMLNFRKSHRDKFIEFIKDNFNLDYFLEEKIKEIIGEEDFLSIRRKKAIDLLTKNKYVSFDMDDHFLKYLSEEELLKLRRLNLDHYKWRMANDGAFHFSDDKYYEKYFGEKEFKKIRHDLFAKDYIENMKHGPLLENLKFFKKYLTEEEFNNAFQPNENFILEKLKANIYHEGYIDYKDASSLSYIKSDKLNNFLIENGYKSFLRDPLIDIVDNSKKYSNKSILEKALLIDYNILCYHGTSVYHYDQILNKGKFLSPRMMGTEGNERRSNWFRSEINEQAGALDQIFLTTNYSYASYYAQRAFESSAEFIKENNLEYDSNNGLIIFFNIPIYKFLEFKILIEDNKDLKERIINRINERLMEQPKKIPYNPKSEKHWYKYFLEENWNMLFEEEPKTLKDIINLIYQIGRTEITIMREVPTKYIIKTEKLYN